MKKRPGPSSRKQQNNLKPKQKSSKKMSPISIADVETDDVESESGSGSGIHESNHPSALRRGAVKISEIKELSNLLIIQASTLNGIVQNMERLGANVLDRVDGVTKGNRGKKLIAEFLANLNRAVTDQQFG